MRAREFITESRTVEFQGLTIRVHKKPYGLKVEALDEWGSKVLGYVEFDSDCAHGKELDPQDLRVDDKYQGQGIAKIMYDFVKSRGYTINRSWDQTDAGAGFWDKHRGEGVRVWEESNSTNIISAEKLWDYVSKIHPKDQQGGGFLKSLVMLNPQYELKRVPLSSLHIPNDEDDGNDPYGRAMHVDVDHANEYSQYQVDKKPLVVDSQGHILDGAHRAWAASELLNKKDIMAWVPVKTRANGPQELEIRKKFTKPGVAEEVNPEVTSDDYTEPSLNVRMGDFVFNARTFTGALGSPNAKGLQIRAYDPKNLKSSIGSADFIVKKDKKGNQWLESDDTEVNDEYRSKGVATMMYAFAKSLGNDIKDSPYQSTAGKNMWKKWGSDAKHLVGEQGVAEGFSNDMSTEDMIAYLRQHHDTNLHQDYLDHINTFSKFVLQNIPVNSIKTDLPALDRAKVEQYKQMDFSKAPPIVIGGGYILDGYHRANVAKALGIPTIKAYVGVQGQQGVAEGITPKDIHKLADRKNVKWDNEPSFLKLTKQLTGKEHLDDLNQAGLNKVKQHLEKQGTQ